jgi:hypothetical protein
MSRAFAAHCANDGHHRSDFVTEADSFEAAAIAFAERWTGPDEACKILVCELETGEERCFTLDLGAPEPCPGAPEP